MTHFLLQSNSESNSDSSNSDRSNSDSSNSESSNSESSNSNSSNSDSSNSDSNNSDGSNSNSSISDSSDGSNSDIFKEGMHSPPSLLQLRTRIIVHAQTAVQQQSNGSDEARMSQKSEEWRD